jgi:membrane protease subunit (stomatin/prohibitin family)
MAGGAPLDASAAQLHRDLQTAAAHAAVGFSTPGTGATPPSAPRKRFCTACGTEAPPGAKFCPNCAAALPQAA